MEWYNEDESCGVCGRSLMLAEGDGWFTKCLNCGVVIHCHPDEYNDARLFVDRMESIDDKLLSEIMVYSYNKIKLEKEDDDCGIENMSSVAGNIIGWFVGVADCHKEDIYRSIISAYFAAWHGYDIKDMSHMSLASLYITELYTSITCFTDLDKEEVQEANRKS